MAYKDYRDDEGSVSGWHEGNFKNIRLHEAQQLINTGKINPLGRNINCWNSIIHIIHN